MQRGAARARGRRHRHAPRSAQPAVRDAIVWARAALGAASCARFTGSSDPAGLRWGVAGCVRLVMGRWCGVMVCRSGGCTQDRERIITVLLLYYYCIITPLKLIQTAVVPVGYTHHTASVQRCS